MTDPHQTRVLFIHHGKGLGGAPLSLLYLVRSLDRNRFEPMVLFLHDSVVIDLFKNEGITTIGPVNLMDFPHTKIWWLRWYHIATLVRAIIDLMRTILIRAPRIYAHYQPDIVHLNTSSLIGWALGAHKKNIPVIWHIREPLADGYFGIRKNLITKCVQRYATAIVPICHDNAQPWITSTKTYVVYNAVDEKLFDQETSPHSFLRKHHLDATTPKILYLGGISPEKGTHVILAVFKKLLVRLPSAQLIIAGSWDTKGASRLSPKRLFPTEQFKQQVQVLHNACGTSLKIIGPCFDVPAAMAACSVIVFPATVGHFARPIIEAGFMQKPVISSKMAPLDELVIHGKTGFLLSHDDEESWVEALFLLLTDSSRNKQMGLDAYAWCTTQFNLEHQVYAIQNIYQQTLKEKAHI
ncbi:MAG: glycosyltransferase family 4 protein [Candidatus Babeliales bacterium]|jgi:glycosyltransferase involved in cell wall biosynthesis